MSSSAKTQKLGLSLWEASDKPERLDFRTDNELLESLVGGHLNNASLHLTEAEKSYVSKPFEVLHYSGGGGTGLHTMYYPAKGKPKILAILPLGFVPVAVINGKLRCYCSVAFSTNAHGVNTGGIVLRDTEWGVRSQEDDEVQEEYTYHLNDRGVWYAALMIY